MGVGVGRVLEQVQVLRGLVETKLAFGVVFTMEMVGRTDVDLSMEALVDVMVADFMGVTFISVLEDSPIVVAFADGVPVACQVVNLVEVGSLIEGGRTRKCSWHASLRS
ncbi:hypothetical protein AURDEDRAFT_156092 [Auricularia subglabra TFB-10046 SS5]|nr:hypothetical protein AURDEDRAFT_156092 [Auricularia subglabra TFB-10046 SS5]